MKDSPSHIIDRINEWIENGLPRLEPLRNVPLRSINGQGIVCPSQSDSEATVALVPRNTDDDDVDLCRIDRIPTDTTSARLMGRCKSSICAYWNGSCQLGILLASVDSASPRVRNCEVRDNCRWYLENGHAVCTNCSTVTYVMHLP